MSLGVSSGDTIADIKAMVEQYGSSSADTPIDKAVESAEEQQIAEPNAKSFEQVDDLYSLHTNVCRQQKRRLIVTTLFSVAGMIAALFGTIFFFQGAQHIAYICAAITILDSFIQVIVGNQKNFATEILTVLIGLIIGIITKISIIDGISIALCIGCLLLSAIGWIFQIITFMRRN